jgi:hypothetical protein
MNLEYNIKADTHIFLSLWSHYLVMQSVIARVPLSMEEK